MTLETAKRLANEIWGGDNTVQLRPDGGADVDTWTDSAVSLSRYHRLDKHGRVACHVSCQDAQKSFIQAEWLKRELAETPTDTDKE